MSISRDITLEIVVDSFYHYLLSWCSKKSVKKRTLFFFFLLLWLVVVVELHINSFQGQVKQRYPMFFVFFKKKKEQGKKLCIKA